MNERAGEFREKRDGGSSCELFIRTRGNKGATAGWRCGSRDMVYRMIVYDVLLQEEVCVVVGHYVPYHNLGLGTKYVFFT